MPMSACSEEEASLLTTSSTISNHTCLLLASSATGCFKFACVPNAQQFATVSEQRAREHWLIPVAPASSGKQAAVTHHCKSDLLPSGMFTNLKFLILKCIQKSSRCHGCHLERHMPPSGSMLHPSILLSLLSMLRTLQNFVHMALFVLLFHPNFNGKQRGHKKSVLCLSKRTMISTWF